MLLVIDNFDSFTYNLVQYCEELGSEVLVRRNDSALSELKSLQPDRILISPGPCTPNEAGVSLAVIEYFSGRIPVMGVCLGHQSIGQAFGGRVVKAPRLMHGKTSLVNHTHDPLFNGVPEQFQATRYHSLIVERSTLPSSLVEIADSEGVIMALRHTPTGAVGVQFHPESILTPYGKTILQNFLAS